MQPLEFFLTLALTPLPPQVMILLTISIVYLTYLIPILLNGESNGARAAAGGAVILIICEVCLPHY